MNRWTRAYQRNSDGAAVEIRSYGTLAKIDFLMVRAIGKKTWHRYAWSVFDETHTPISTTTTTTPEVKDEA